MLLLPPVVTAEAAEDMNSAVVAAGVCCKVPRPPKHHGSNHVDDELHGPECTGRMASSKSLVKGGTDRLSAALKQENPCRKVVIVAAVPDTP